MARKGKVSNSGQKLFNLGFSFSSCINTFLLLTAGIPVCLSVADRKMSVCATVPEAQDWFQPDMPCRWQRASSVTSAPSCWSIWREWLTAKLDLYCPCIDFFVTGWGGGTVFVFCSQHLQLHKWVYNYTSKRIELQRTHCLASLIKLVNQHFSWLVIIKTILLCYIN